MKNSEIEGLLYLGLQPGAEVEYDDAWGKVVPCVVTRIDRRGRVHVRLTERYRNPVCFFEPGEVGRLRARSTRLGAKP